MQQLTKLNLQIPRKTTCQTQKHHKPNKTNKIPIANEFYPIRYAKYRDKKAPAKSRGSTFNPITLLERRI
jgi:hypothetical protein